MKKILSFFAVLALASIAASLCAFGQSKTTDGGKGSQMKNNTIKLAIKGGRTFTATLADNSSARALAELLARGDVSVEMKDYARMEKVGPLGKRLPRNDKPISTGPGDLILYQGSQFVIYYGTNSWTLTRLGKIDNATGEELLSALGDGDVTVTLSLNK